MVLMLYSAGSAKRWSLSEYACRSDKGKSESIHPKLSNPNAASADYIFVVNLKAVPALRILNSALPHLP